MSAAALEVGWGIVGAIVLFSGTFAFRALPRCRRDRFLGTSFPLKGDVGDSMVHLIIADMIRRNGHRIPDEAPQFLFGVHFDYPAFFHKLVSYIPKRAAERWDWVFTPALDATHCVLFFALSWYLLSAHLAFSEPLLGAFVASAAFTLTPLLSAPARRPAIGERPLGFLFGHVYFIGLALFLIEGGIVWLAVAVVAASFAATTSKFTIQAMVLVSIVLALALLHPAPILVLALGTAGALVLSQGYVLRIARGLTRHSRFYARELMHYHDYVRGYGNAMLVTSLRHLSRGRPLAAWREIERHPIRYMLQHVPWLWPLVLATLFAPVPEEASSDAVATLLGWAWAAMIVAILTSLDRFKFLGEGFRYVEFALLPMILTIFLLPWELGGPLWALFAVVELVAAVRRSKLPVAFDGPVQEARDLVDFLAMQPPCTIFAIPGRLTFPLCYGTGHRALWLLANIDVGQRGREWASLFARSGIYPYPDPDAVEIVRERFGADLLVVWKAPARLAENVWGRAYKLDGYKVLFENAAYVVLDLAAPTTLRKQLLPQSEPAGS